jgi:hypothetical protein
VSSRVAVRGVAVAGLVAVSGIGAASCVPASEAAKPAGAFGFHTEPTPASRGAPFETDDGWTVHVELLALQLQINATSSRAQLQESFSGDSVQYRLRASERADLFGRGLDVGIADASVSFGRTYIGNGSDEEDSIENIGLSSEEIVRFRAPAEAAPTYSYRANAGPSIVLVARGERAGRIVRIDLTMEPSSSLYVEASGEVQANALTTASLVVAAEALFTSTTGGKLVFDDLAAIDANHDGVVTGAELGATARANTESRLGLYDEISARSVRMLSAL